MTWLILPPQSQQYKDRYRFRVDLGLSSQWPSPAAYQAFNNASLSSQPTAERYMPITRNPRMGMAQIDLPKAMKVSVTDPEGSRQRSYEGPLPDVLFGPAFSWFVSQRVCDLMEKAAPGAVRLEKADLVWEPDRPVPGVWYLVVFQQYADVILEDRSNLLSVFATYATWDRHPAEEPPLLLAHRASVEGLAFWTGTATGRDAPCNAASVGFTYCSDAVMDCLTAQEITGFGPCLEIRLIDGDDTVTIAPRAPLIARAGADDTGDSFHAIDVPTAHFGGVVRNSGDDGISSGSIAPRVPTAEPLPDMWTMERLLVVSHRAKAVFEAYAAADCLFAEVICVPDQGGRTYAGPDRFHVLTPRKILRPYSLEQSSGVSAGMLPDGQLSLKTRGAGMVVNADMVGGCCFWDATLPGTGPPEFVCSAPLVAALTSAEISGLSVRHDYPSRRYEKSDR